MWLGYVVTGWFLIKGFLILINSFPELYNKNARRFCITHLALIDTFSHESIDWGCESIRPVLDVHYFGHPDHPNRV
jgi:hypothetical protein